MSKEEQKLEQEIEQLEEKLRKLNRVDVKHYTELLDEIIMIKKSIITLHEFILNTICSKPEKIVVLDDGVTAVISDSKENVEYVNYIY